MICPARDTQRRAVQVVVTLVAMLALTPAGAQGANGHAGNQSSVRVLGLETESAERLLGVDVAAPRLSWRLASSRRGVTQRAFQVRVASSPHLLRDGKADVWDSGRRSGGDPWTDYAGRGLSSRTRYWWSVRIWDEDGKPTDWASDTWFETGFLNASEWEAGWISRPTTGEPIRDCSDLRPTRVQACPPPNPILRTEFDAAKPVKQARLYASGLGYGVYHLNGQRVGDLQLAPAYTDYDERVFYNTFDVTDSIRRGRNALGAELGRGYYSLSESGVLFELENATWHDEPKLRLELHLTYADGTTHVVRSGPQWTATTGPTLYDNLFRGETYDGARAAELGHWTSAGYDDGGWQQATTAAAPEGQPLAQTVEPERVVERRRFKSVKEVKPGVFVFDLGEAVSGWAAIRVKGERGARVQLLHGLDRREDGSVPPPANEDRPPDDPSPSLFPIPEQTDVYRLAGTGKPEYYRPQFVYHGFQFVQVTGWPRGKPTLDDVTAEVVYADMPLVGDFSSSDGLLNRILDAGRRTFLMSAHGMVTSQPVHEKNGWMGDGQLVAPSWTWLFDAHRMQAKWATDMQDGQSAEGELPEFAPASPTAESRLGIPDTNGVIVFRGPTLNFDMALFEVPRDVHRYYGDTRSLTVHYDAMKSYEGYVSRHAVAGFLPPGSNECDGLCFGPPGMGDLNNVVGAPYGQWPDGNAWWYEMHRVLAQTGRLLGRDAEAGAFEQQAEAIKEQFNDTFLDRAAGVYRDPTETSGVYSQHVNAMALELGLVPDEVRQRVADSLAADVRARDHHLSTGAVGTRFLWPALSNNGHLQEALLTAQQKTAPGYGYWLDELGQTTFSDDWVGGRCCNDQFKGSIVQWFFEELAGITPLEPGFATIEFRPEVPVTGLDRAAASNESVRGKVASVWRKARGRLEVEVTVPPTARGLVHVPAASPRAVNAPKDARLIRDDGDRVVYAVGSGTYRFSARR
jgi:alpha-L-rhamnosidase